MEEKGEKDLILAMSSQQRRFTPLKPCHATCNSAPIHVPPATPLLPLPPADGYGSLRASQESQLHCCVFKGHPDHKKERNTLNMSNLLYFESVRVSECVWLKR